MENGCCSKKADNLKSAENYYGSMLKKDFDTMARYLHQNVEFIGPLSKAHGKAEVIEAAKSFSNALLDISIRSRFACDDRIVLIYDLTFSASSEKLPAAVMMNFTDNLISRIEVFYDTKLF